MYATVIVSILIIIAVLIPGSTLPDVEVGGYDKLIHTAMFAAWTVAIRYDLDKKKLNNFRLFAGGLLFSGLTEILQLLVEGRSFDVYDMAADALGLLIGLLIGSPMIRWVKKLTE
jgi:VanZ family protein